MAVRALPDFALALQDVRRATLELIEPLSTHELETVHDPIMSPLVWDLGHIAAYEDLWCNHRHGGADLLRADLADLYDAFETPRSQRGDIPLLKHQDALDYMDEVRARTHVTLLEHGPGDGTLFEMVVRHEAQHNETMRQALFLAGLPGGTPERATPAPAASAWIEIPGGPAAIGAEDDGFAFDNERPRHERHVDPFTIARRPLTNGSWLTFAEGGGYERREWWSDEGWAWKEEYDITHPLGWGTGARAVDTSQPVMHVSWFEADAFARAHGARLPTEWEWERAATWNQDPIEQTGAVWEWTATAFDGYPGFEPFPYPEYSQVFFGDRYRVLRGGSWATSDRVRTHTFRNWDLPERRQIFSGVRLVKDRA